MIKTVIFDFDGVLVESAGIKTNAFQEIFSRWPHYQDAMMAYHNQNSGISRHVKFQYLYEKYLKQNYTPQIGDELSRDFAELVVKKVKEAPLVQGTLQFLRNYRHTYRFFIASATPQHELEDILVCKGLALYFQEVWGAPRIKPDIIKDIIKRYNFSPAEVIFVGDGESDLIASGVAGVAFVLRKTPENEYLHARVGDQIRDISELFVHIKKREGQMND